MYMPKNVAINYLLVLPFHLPLLLPLTPAETQKPHLRLQWIQFLVLVIISGNKNDKLDAIFKCKRKLITLTSC